MMILIYMIDKYNLQSEVRSFVEGMKSSLSRRSSMQSLEMTKGTIAEMVESFPSILDEPSLQNLPPPLVKPDLERILKHHISLVLQSFLTKLTSSKQRQEFIDLCLLEASQLNLPDLVYFLLVDGYEGTKASLLSSNTGGKNSLHIASELGHQELVKTILSLCSEEYVNSLDHNNRSSLHLACKNGHGDTALLLIERGADFNMPDYLNNTAVHYIVKSNLKAVFERIMNLRPDLLVENYTGETPLEASVNRDIPDMLGNLQIAPITIEISPRSPGAPNPLDFNVIRRIGKGSFGKVFLVEYCNRLYAMKVINKKRVLSSNILRYIVTERNVLSAISHPFIVGLKFAFQSEHKFFLVIDYCPGGDLCSFLNRHKKIPEKLARNFAAEIFLAIEELHRNDIAYRDLKPENVVINADGHLCLTDFGLSKEGLSDEDFTTSFCGSIAYFPPEILNRQKYGKSVDWYLLGVIIYEMIAGLPPFYSKNQKQIFDNIKNREADVPYGVSNYCKDLLRRLLCKDPAMRISGEEIKVHPFFRSLDWRRVIKKQLKVPKPVLSDIRPDSSVSDVLTKENFEGFSKIEGWSYSFPNS